MYHSPLFKWTKRPPGPSYFEIGELFSGSETFLPLDYPVQLTKKYGEIFRLPIARKTYFITGARGMEQILKTRANNFTRDNVFYKRFQAVFGKSLLVTDGSYWRHRRKISQPAFQMAMVKNYAPVITKIAEPIIENLKQNPGNTVNVLSLMNLITFKIAFEIFCERSISNETIIDLGKSVSYANWYVTHSLIIKPWKPTLSNLRFYFYMKKLDGVLLKIIQERRQESINSSKPVEPDSQDLLGMLLTAQNETETALLNDKEILDEFKTLLLTGHETTAVGLSWMWYLLAKHPQYRTLMEEELETVLQGRTATFNDVNQLPILRAIVSETFRLYPPIWSVLRRNIEEDEVCGYRIPANSLFFLNIYALHRNPSYWDNSEEFYPPRFLGDSFKNLHPFAYLPFSTGPRICIANHLAMVETMLLAATVAQKYRFDIIPKKTKACPQACISLRLKGGLWMKAVPR